MRGFRTRAWVATLALCMACGGSSHAYRSGMASAPAQAEAMPESAPSAESYDFAGESIDGDSARSAPSSARGQKPSRRRTLARRTPSAAPSPVKNTTQPARQKSQPITPKVKARSTVRRAPLLIYTANLYMAVFEASKSIDAVEQVASDLGGYLVQRNANQITVRVPAENFREAMEVISKSGDELRRDVKAQDVTAQFRDLQARLKNLTAVRNRFEALLRRANNVNEAMAIERQLERVTGQIEQIKGKLKYFKELIAFSTITVRFSAVPVEKVRSGVDLPFDWLSDLGLPNLFNLRRK